MTTEADRYFFIHLQKTAGTALLRRLRHQFGVDAVYPPPEEQGTPEVVLDVGHLLARLRALGPQIRVVTGHFPLCATELLDGPHRTFTVVRDPVERTLSHLRHQREVDPVFAHSTLDAVYAGPNTSRLVTDHMVRMLSLESAEMTDGALTPIDVDGDRIERACEHLEHRIDVLGLQEHFETFCRDLEEAFGWDLGPPVFMNRTAPLPASDALVERIREDNAADLALYDFARELWARRHPSS